MIVLINMFQIQSIGKPQMTRETKVKSKNLDTAKLRIKTACY